MEEESSYPPWVDLPSDITAMILLKLGTLEILTTAQIVCRTWWRVCQDASMWRSIEMNLVLDHFPGRSQSWHCRIHGEMPEMYIHAVDRSRGQLVDLTIQVFTGDFLFSISERCNQLKRLQLTCLEPGDSLTKAIRNLPLLEELHLYFVYIDAEEVEEIGSLCQHLKSFTMNDDFERRPLVGRDLVAHAIAKTMPELCHLKLMGNTLTNAGLQAILDGCPHLESLDMRRCFYVRVDLRKLCSDRIRDLRYPDDPIDADEFLASDYDLRDRYMYITTDSDSEMDSDSSYSSHDDSYLTDSDDEYGLNDSDDEYGLNDSDDEYITEDSNTEMVPDSSNSHHDTELNLKGGGDDEEGDDFVGNEN